MQAKKVAHRRCISIGPTSNEPSRRRYGYIVVSQDAQVLALFGVLLDAAVRTRVPAVVEYHSRHSDRCSKIN
jgi:hypothetical protein